MPPEVPTRVGSRAGSPEPSPLAVATPPPADRPHLVVVTTRPLGPEDEAPDGTLLATRFWHPRDLAWKLNYFESLEHALHLFVEESGWVVLQQQALDGPLAYEVVFRAREEDFRGPRSAEEMLQAVGMTPEEVEDLLDKMEPPAP